MDIQDAKSARAFAHGGTLLSPAGATLEEQHTVFYPVYFFSGSFLWISLIFFVKQKRRKRGLYVKVKELAVKIFQERAGFPAWERWWNRADPLEQVWVSCHEVNPLPSEPLSSLDIKHTHTQRVNWVSFNYVYNKLNIYLFDHV